MSTITVERTITTQYVKCDFCDAASESKSETGIVFYRMHKCYGCGRDLCSNHAIYAEDLFPGLTGCNYLCDECHSPLMQARKAASAIMTEACIKIDEIMNAWKDGCRHI